MNLGPLDIAQFIVMANMDDSSPSDYSSGRFSYQEIFTYLKEGEYPEDFEKKDKQALRKRVKFFAVKDAHLYYVGGKFIVVFILGYFH